jgi:gamma-glutamylcyclotransferase
MTLVFQYGSNCLDSQINGVDRLRGDARFIGIAQTVEDFRLSFDVWSNGRNCAAANIVPYPGNKVWGALYEIPDHLIDRVSAKAYGRKSLDAIEGKKYRRENIRVRLADDQLVTAVTYLVIDPEAGMKTSFEYVGHIVAGLKERGIPSTYIALVKQIAADNNPGIAESVNAIEPLIQLSGGMASGTKRSS